MKHKDGGFLLLKEAKKISREFGARQGHWEIFPHLVLVEEDTWLLGSINFKAHNI